MWRRHHHFFDPHYTHGFDAEMRRFHRHMNRFFEDDGWIHPWFVADHLLKEPQLGEGEPMEEEGEKKDRAVSAPRKEEKTVSPFRHRFGGWYPLVDVHDGEDKITIEAELPGVKKEDIHIDVKGNILSLSGETKCERKEDDHDGYHLMERSYGSFKRSFTLPPEAHSDEVNAQYEDGILSVTIPKDVKPKEKEEVRKIEIK
eukprot:TRINITY_DN619_c0_g1_i1.p2 TRINITY_DN619_c0_g1~~TRINITY_DN619_c0_g1_i1.p2  ORF type:complete len:201 (+),score=81.36 TRINITY_DN619_c0_g1_i1:322-924(+)